jgi:UDP-N-acetylglucosamine--N-acetylmuramyl-(pentapeptide) pyrophosphoryl-undecaprenol N-acetylglucosamine transferase
MATQRRIAIAAGGTAGHVYPALATADAYREAFPDTEILFIGSPHGLESRLVPARGYDLEIICGAPLVGAGAGGKIRALTNLAIGTGEARRLLKARNTRFVIGFGGYASAGALIAARSLGLRTAIHEANVVPGLANRWLGRLADRIYLAFGETKPAFSESRALVTGNPVRHEIVSVREKRRQSFGRSGSRVRVLVTGGSGGSDFLNRRVPALLGKIAGLGFTLEARHQAGEVSLEPIRSAYATAGIPASVATYIDDMAEAYAWADFAIACAGSQTLSELSVCGLPYLLVPLAGAAADHQIDNAVAFTERGNGLWVRQEAWDADSLAGEIGALLGERQRRGDALETETAPREIDAAERLIADVEAIMRGRW